MRVLGDVVLVCHQDYRVSLMVKLIKETHDFMRSLRVEVSCRLVREDD